MSAVYGVAMGLIFGACGVVFVEMTGPYHPDAPEHLNH